MSALHERKHAPYLFWGETSSLCETCLLPVQAKIIFEDDNVFYLKRCHEHGVQKSLVSTDKTYWQMTKQWIKAGDRPFALHSKTDYGCPYDCGLCPDHEQHSCLALLEVNEYCNLSCPVCFADSGPSKAGEKTIDEIKVMLDTLVEAEHTPDVVQLSGGEPTYHSRIEEILTLCKQSPIRHLMINTNGYRIAKDDAFVDFLKTLMPGFEVYLQFDSLNPDALTTLRGKDTHPTHLAALDKLEKAGISTTLVVVVKKGVNDTELGAIIDFALNYQCIRGITFQPVQDAGRNEGFDKNRDRMLLSDIRKAIGAQSAHFSESDLIPLPCNPEHISIAYALRKDKQLIALSSMLPKDFVVQQSPNAIAFEKYPELQKRVFELFSLSTAEMNESTRLSALLCCLPEVITPAKIDYGNVFRITIVEFMDKYNFDIGTVKRSCIHFVTPQRQIIPFETYNMFYRNGLVDKLRQQLPQRKARA